MLIDVVANITTCGEVMLNMEMSQDYGQSKTLSDEQRLKFAEMILALNQSKQDKVVAAMSALVTSSLHTLIFDPIH